MCVSQTAIETACGWMYHQLEEGLYVYIFLSVHKERNRECVYDRLKLELELYRSIMCVINWNGFMCEKICHIMRTTDWNRDCVYMY